MAIVDRKSIRPDRAVERPAASRSHAMRTLTNAPRRFQDWRAAPGLRRRGGRRSVGFVTDAAAPLAIAQAAEEQQAFAAQDDRVVLDEQLDAVVGRHAGAIGA